MSVDPLAHEFYSWSPYNFCLNNPIKLIDPDGRAPKDIIILNSPNIPSSSSTPGHLAVLIGSDEKGWTYISKNGLDPKNLSWYSNIPIIGLIDNVIGGKSDDKIEHFKTKADFDKERKTNPEYKYYSNEVRLKTTEKEDNMAKEAAEKSVKSSYTIFNSGSCVGVVTEALAAVGLDPGYITNEINPSKITGFQKTTVKTLSINPNQRFEKIKENNKSKIVEEKNKNNQTKKD